MNKGILRKRLTAFVTSCIAFFCFLQPAAFASGIEDRQIEKYVTRRAAQGMTMIELDNHGRPLTCKDATKAIQYITKKSGIAVYRDGTTLNGKDIVRTGDEARNQDDSSSKLVIKCDILRQGSASLPQLVTAANALCGKTELTGLAFRASDIDSSGDLTIVDVVLLAKRFLAMNSIIGPLENLPDEAESEQNPVPLPTQSTSTVTPSLPESNSGQPSFFPGWDAAQTPMPAESASSTPISGDNGASSGSTLQPSAPQPEGTKPVQVPGVNATASPTKIPDSTSSGKPEPTTSVNAQPTGTSGPATNAPGGNDSPEKPTTAPSADLQPPGTNTPDATPTQVPTKVPGENDSAENSKPAADVQPTQTQMPSAFPTGSPSEQPTATSSSDAVPGPGDANSSDNTKELDKQTIVEKIYKYLNKEQEDHGRSPLRKNDDYTRQTDISISALENEESALPSSSGPDKNGYVQIWGYIPADSKNGSSMTEEVIALKLVKAIEDQTVWNDAKLLKDIHAGISVSKPTDEKINVHIYLSGNIVDPWADFDKNKLSDAFETLLEDKCASINPEHILFPDALLSFVAEARMINPANPPEIAEALFEGTDFLLEDYDLGKIRTFSERLPLKDYVLENGTFNYATMAQAYLDEFSSEDIQKTENTAYGIAVSSPEDGKAYLELLMYPEPMWDTKDSKRLCDNIFERINRAYAVAEDGMVVFRNAGLDELATKRMEAKVTGSALIESDLDEDAHCFQTIVTPQNIKGHCVLKLVSGQVVKGLEAKELMQSLEPGSQIGLGIGTKEDAYGYTVYAECIVVPPKK